MRTRVLSARLPVKEVEAFEEEAKAKKLTTSEHLRQILKQSRVDTT
jgi:hypothetical protein